MKTQSQLAAQMEKVHALIAERFIHPGVGLIYDYIAPPGTAAPWSHLPTPEEIAADRPNVSG